MPRQPNLRGFLRKEVLKNRIQPPSPPSQRSPSPESIREQTPPDFEAEPETTTNVGEVETDSLFGLPVHELEGISKDHAWQVQLEKLLAQGPASPTTPTQRHLKRNPDLASFKEELEMLVTGDLEASPREKKLVKRQRAALVQEISRLEAEERGEEFRGLKAKLDKDAESLPEPVGAYEKKKLEWHRNRVTKALAGLEKASTKRKDREEDPDNDLDGEELLRMGKQLKRPPANVSGHWQKNIHDYFPKSEADGDESTELKNLSVQEKQLLRRELAEYGERLAKAERKKKALVEI